VPEFFLTISPALVWWWQLFTHKKGDAMPVFVYNLAFLKKEKDSSGQFSRLRNAIISCLEEGPEEFLVSKGSVEVHFPSDQYGDNPNKTVVIELKTQEKEGRSDAVIKKMSDALVDAVFSRICLPHYPIRAVECFPILIKRTHFSIKKF
jgi:hypothetical protein